MINCPDNENDCGCPWYPEELDVYTKKKSSSVAKDDNQGTDSFNPVYFSCLIFPNPTNGSFKVSITDKKNAIFTIEVINSFGQIIERRNNCTNQEEFNIEGHKGLYIVKVYNQDQIIVNSLIIN